MDPPGKKVKLVNVMYAISEHHLEPPPRRLAGRRQRKRHAQVADIHDVRRIPERPVLASRDRPPVRLVRRRLVLEQDVQHVVRRPARAGEPHRVARRVVVLVRGDREPVVTGRRRPAPVRRSPAGAVRHRPRVGWSPHCHHRRDQHRLSPPRTRTHSLLLRAHCRSRSASGRPGSGQPEQRKLQTHETGVAIRTRSIEHDRYVEGMVEEAGDRTVTAGRQTRPLAKALQRTDMDATWPWPGPTGSAGCGATQKLWPARAASGPQAPTTRPPSHSKRRGPAQMT